MDPHVNRIGPTAILCKNSNRSASYGAIISHLPGFSNQLARLEPRGSRQTPLRNTGRCAVGQSVCSLPMTINLFATIVCPSSFIAVMYIGSLFPRDLGSSGRPCSHVATCAKMHSSLQSMREACYYKGRSVSNTSFVEMGMPGIVVSYRHQSI